MVVFFFLNLFNLMIREISLVRKERAAACNRVCEG